MIIKKKISGSTSFILGDQLKQLRDLIISDKRHPLFYSQNSFDPYNPDPQKQRHMVESLRYEARNNDEYLERLQRLDGLIPQVTFRKIQ